MQRLERKKNRVQTDQISRGEWTHRVAKALDKNAIYIVRGRRSRFDHPYRIVDHRQQHAI